MAKPLVGIIMGSLSDWETMQHALEMLEKLKIACEVKVVSAHRTPDLLFEYVTRAEARGLKVLIAGAGGAAHLPGMAASKTTLPVLGVPVESKSLKGMDSLLSIAQMPAGVPVATLAIGKAGAINAAVLAASILSISDPKIGLTLKKFRLRQTHEVLSIGDPRSMLGIKKKSKRSRFEIVMTFPESIEKRLGIVGGGQLGKMLCAAASNLGIETLFIDPSNQAVSRHVAQQLCAAFDDKASLQQLFDSCKAVTFEFENVSLEALSAFEHLEKLAPNLNALFIANDRIREKEFFLKCGLEVAPFVAIEVPQDRSDQQFLDVVASAAEKLGYPVILKTCSLGYDGKGQISLSSKEDLNNAIELKNSGRLILEKRVGFEREVSVIAARSSEGDVVCYPTPNNVHKNGILFSCYVTEELPNAALKKYISAIMSELNYVGVLAIEFFEINGKFLANEMAPRVHNSGHWTIEGTVTSQFENHVRAIMGLALGDTSLRLPTAMLNIIGVMPDFNKVLKVPGAHLHCYGKEARPGRKLGHITIEAKDLSELKERFDRLAIILQSRP